MSPTDRELKSLDQYLTVIERKVDSAILFTKLYTLCFCLVQVQALVNNINRSAAVVFLVNGPQI